MTTSNAYEVLMLNHITGNGSQGFVSQIFVSLHTGNPGEDGLNNELTDSGYVRQAINFNNATTSGATSNSTITFPDIVNTSPTVSHFGLWTSSSGGTFIYKGVFSNAREYPIGSAPKIPTNGITISTNGNWSNYLISELLDHILGTSSWTQPSFLRLHLYTSNPGPSDSGTEVSGIGYAPQAISMGASASGITSNITAENFGPVGGPWGAVSHWGLKDSVGNLLLYGPWDSTVSPIAGDDYILNAGDLVIELL